jgi:hypothetical protein
MYEVDQYTVALLHFEDGLKDECGGAWTATGNAVVSTDQKVDGNSSLFTPAGSFIKSAANSNYAFGSGDFTIDFWMYYESGYSGVSSAMSSGIGVFIQPDIIQFGAATTAVPLITNAPGFVLNKWAHYALVRKSGIVYWFVNGILRTTISGASNISVNQFVINARYGSGAYVGGTAYYDEFRISNIARWTSNFNSEIGNPTGLIAIAGDSQVTLSWTAVNAAVGYNIKRSTATGGPYTTIATNVAGTSYVDSTVTSGTTYYYVVTAVDGSGNEGANSNEAFATLAVSPPINLTAISGNSQVVLSWGAVNAASGYNVKRSTTAGGPYSIIATNVAVTNYADSIVTNGTTYYYVVTALNANGESVNSNEASATPMASSNALLRVTMLDSSEREYQISTDEIDGFINWLNQHVSTDTVSYMLNKIETLQNSKEYLVFDKIISFEVIPLTK